MTDDELFSVLSEIADEEIMAKNRSSIIEVGRRILRTALGEMVPRYDWTTTGMKQSPDGAWVMASAGEKK